MIATIFVAAMAALGATATEPRVSGPWTHDWSSMASQLWVDFAGAEHQYLPTPAQLQFIASTYAIVSLEKCFAQANFSSTEDAVAVTASALKSLNPAVRVLFYRHTLMDFGDCYRSGAVFESHPSWWLRDDSGQPYGSSSRHLFDLTQSAVVSLVSSAAVNVSGASSLLDGVFGDGTADMSMSNMNPSRFAELVSAHHASLNATRASIRKSMRPGSLLIGNGLTQYPNNPPDHGLAQLGDVDGVCFEHFLSFEMLDPSNGSLVPAMYQQAVELIGNATAAGKVVLVRGWPGPVSQPIGPLGPSWTSSAGAEAPTTYAGRAAAATTWLEASLAGYLIIADVSTYFSYNWWYTAPDGVYPCPAGECSAPAAWYPELSQPLGAPQGPYERDGWVYRRSFEHAHVVFDARNVSASTIQWTA